jgi:hypothetical protein
MNEKVNHRVRFEFRRIRNADRLVCELTKILSNEKYQYLGDKIAIQS